MQRTRIGYNILSIWVQTEPAEDLFPRRSWRENTRVLHNDLVSLPHSIYTEKLVQGRGGASDA